MLRKFGLVTAVVFAGVGTAATAEEHYILMLGDGYFPDIVHPAIGDTLRFVNLGVGPMAATATDETWTTGLVAPDEHVIVPVTDGMRQTFANTLPPGAPVSGLSGDYVQNDATVGVIDYLNPPNTTLNPITKAEFVYPGN